MLMLANQTRLSTEGTFRPYIYIYIYESLDSNNSHSPPKLKISHYKIKCGSKKSFIKKKKKSLDPYVFCITIHFFDV